MDLHPDVGNNVVLARQLGLGQLAPFDQYKGVALGVWGDAPSGLSREGLVERVILADADSDGKLDIIVANNGAAAGNTLSVLHNQSTPGALDTGAFASRVNFVVGAAPIRMAAGDLDGDGRLDLAVAAGGGVSVLRNTGSPGTITAGSFAPHVQFLTGPNTTDVEISDLDGDGKRDLLVVSYDAGTVSVLRNVGTSGSLDANSFARMVAMARQMRPGA